MYIMEINECFVKLSLTPYIWTGIKQFFIFFYFCLFPASFDNKISTAHQHHTNSIHHQHNNHHSPNRRSFRNKQNTTNSSNFHHAFHDRQRASHRALFGGGPKQASHNPKNGGGNSHNAFRSSLIRSQELVNRFNSDDTHSRFHRARSSPPLHRRNGNGNIQARHGNNWRASHGDLYTMSDGMDNNGTVESVNFQRLGVQGLRSRFSMHDLHEANAMRASRADLRDARDALHLSRRMGNSHHSLSRNDLRASRRSKSGRKGAELFESNHDTSHQEDSLQQHHHHHHQCSKCAMHSHNHHHSPRAHNSPKKQKSPHHLPIPHTDVFGPGAFHY